MMTTSNFFIDFYENEIGNENGIKLWTTNIGPKCPGALKNPEYL